MTIEQKSLAMLAECDAGSAREIEWRSVPWRDQVVCFGGAREVHRSGGDTRGVSRQRFVDILASRARQLGVDIRYEQEIRDQSELTAADLIVAADGVSSQLRGPAEFGTRVTEGRNKYVWLGTGKSFDSFHFFFEPTEAGWIWAHAYQHEPTASTFIVECEPQTWTGLGFDKCSPSRMLMRLEGIFAEGLAGRQLWTQFSDGADAPWLNFRTVSNERWYHGNVVLVGDSAHTAHFSVGLGTTLALQDVSVLATHLQRMSSHTAAGLSQALQTYQDQRQAELRAHAIEAERSAQWFEQLPRYVGLTPHQFSTVLHARRAPLLPKLPPRLFCRLHAIRKRFAALDKLRARYD